MEENASPYQDVQTSCSICYQAFGDEEDTVPRIQPCSHVYCTSCLKDCFNESNPDSPRNKKRSWELQCPECFVSHLIESIEALPVYTEGLEASKEIQRNAEDAEHSYDNECTDSSYSNGHVRRSHRITDELNGTERGDQNSKFGQFLLQTSNQYRCQDSPPSDDCYENESGEVDIQICSVEGCNQRDTYRTGFCMLHTKRASRVTVNAMVDKMKSTGLKAVSLKCDKVGVRARTIGKFELDDIATRFKKQERMDLGEAIELIETASGLMKVEQNVVELRAPVMVVGDLHGQYFDLLNILRMWRTDHSLLFLGDYVDRGAFSCEVILHLLALKLKHPGKVFLLRGNHECCTVSSHFGFKEECKVKYGLTVYYQFLNCFQSMPIAAIIQSQIGKIFAAHGGISPSLHTIEDINEIDRFAEPEVEGPLCDILWSDPMNEDEVYKLTDHEYREFLQMDFIKNQVRGCSYMFGYKAAARFLRENKLIYMLRAHEVQEEGFRSHFANPKYLCLGSNTDASECHSDVDESTDTESSEDEAEVAEAAKLVLRKEQKHMYPTVLTVFSAPNYCDRYGNKAAILYIESMGYYTVNLLEAEPHPVPMIQEDVSLMQLLAMGKTCPYMPTNFREFLRTAFEMGPALNPEEVTNGHIPAPATVDAWSIMSPKLMRSTSISNKVSPSPGRWKEVKSSIVATLEKVNDDEAEDSQEAALDTSCNERIASVIKQNSWNDVLSPSSNRQREMYRRAHARDGINEMHPDVISKRLNSSDNIEVLGKRPTLSFSSIDSETSSGNKVKQTILLDLNSEYGTEKKSKDPLFHRIRKSVASNLDDSQQIVDQNTPNATSEKTEQSHPGQVFFSPEEIIVLKLIFSLFDRKGKEFITRDDIIAYADEGGDYAQLKEVDACMEAIDADMDGKLGLHDYINFAARLKTIYEMQVQRDEGESFERGRQELEADDYDFQRMVIDAETEECLQVFGMSRIFASAK